MQKRRDVEEVLKLTKEILIEAGKFFGKAPGDISGAQFHAVANGRLSVSGIANTGITYSQARDYLFPSTKKKLTNESLECIQRILKNAK